MEAADFLCFVPMAIVAAVAWLVAWKLGRSRPRIVADAPKPAASDPPGAGSTAAMVQCPCCGARLSLTPLADAGESC